MNRQYNIPLLSSYLLYFAISIFFWNSWLYSIGPDFISQVSIGHKYADGHLKEALNGWWSPLFNWLLAFCFKLGLNDFTAFRTINFLTGIGIFYFIHRFIKAFTGNSSWLMIAVSPIISFYALSCDSTDVLTVFFFFLFLHLLLKLREEPAYTTALQLAVVAALGYLSKTYNLYYFALILVLFFFVQLFIARFRLNKLVLTALVSLLVFMAIDSAWAYAISKKYGQFSYSTRGRFTDKEVGENQLIMPMSYRGITVPPDEYAYSAWDDPMIFLEKDARQTAQAGQISAFIKGTVIRNIKGFFQYNISIYQLLILLFFSPFLITRYKRKLAWPFIMTVIFPLGFFLFHNEDRFYWPVVLMLMSGIIIGFESFFRNIQQKNFFRIASLLVIALLFVYRPLMRLQHEPDQNFYRFYNALHGNRNLEYLQLRRFASLNNRWDHGLYASYALGGFYYGETKVGISKEELMKSIDENDIDGILVFENSLNKESLPPPVSIISLSNIGLKIYSYK